MNNIYEERIQKALSYIEMNLTKSISLSEIAEHSYFSPFHFHRILVD